MSPVTASAAIVLEPPIAPGAARCLGIGGRARTGLAQPLVCELGSLPVGDRGGPAGLGARRRPDGVPARRRRPALAFARCAFSSPAAAAFSARASSSASRGDGHEVAVARRPRPRPDVDGRTPQRLFDETAPELVFHLAAEVGGIGANRANPGRYWYANLMMGAHVLEQARLHATPKLVIAGTICAYPKFAPVPFHEDDLWNGYPEETNAPYGVAKKAILVGAQAYREQYGSNAIFLLPVEPVRPGRQLRPRDVARDPGADPEDGRGAGGERGRAVGRRHADARVPLRRRLRRGPRCSPPSATTAPSR